VKKYLLNQTGEDSKLETPSDFSYVFDRATWIPWTTPPLN
jgi:hypothetical protein